MVKRKTTWVEKLNDSKDLPRVQEAGEKMSLRWGTGTFVIPAPREVNEIMRLVPRGRLITINQIREALARKHRVNFACPITTGIFAWIAANAAAEMTAAGETDTTPYWRTVKVGGELNSGYPGGVEDQAARLRAEGHEIVPGKGKKAPTVKDYEGKLVEA